jgi:hypothetical protein
MRTRPRVYIAHPIATYGTAWEHACLAALQDLLPDVELYNPARHYADGAIWRRAWPRVLETLSGLVVFPSLDGTIGAGCLRELFDAVACRIPIAGLEESMLYEIETFEFLRQHLLTARRVGRLVLGDQIDATEFLVTRTLAASFQSNP